MEVVDVDTPDDAAGRRRYRTLPEPVRPEDTVESQPTADAPDPQGGRDTERDFMLRYAGAI